MIFQIYFLVSLKRLERKNWLYAKGARFKAGFRRWMSKSQTDPTLAGQRQNNPNTHNCLDHTQRQIVEYVWCIQALKRLNTWIRMKHKRRLKQVKDSVCWQTHKVQHKNKAGVVVRQTQCSAQELQSLLQIDLYRHEHRSFQKSGLSRVRSSTEGKHIRADNKIECLLPLCSSSWALFSSAFCSSPDDWEESILQPVRGKMYGGGGWRREKEERVQVETDSKVARLDWAAGMRQYEGETEGKGQHREKTERIWEKKSVVVQSKYKQTNSASATVERHTGIYLCTLSVSH